MGGHVTSSAGAVGPMQFIPLTWSQYGADGDGDGKRDIASAPDAIFAAANYLHASGAPADWHKAIFAYNHAEWYVRDVLRLAVRYGGELHCTIEGGLFSTAEATGPAEFGRAITLRAPRSFTPLPPWAVPPGYPRQSCDTRIVPNLLFLLQRYDLRVTACRATGHRTHGAGTAADIVPSDAGKQSSWSRVAKMASDMGWRPACARHGCIGSVAPALRAIFYNGYPGHGDPRHTRSAHGHVWWDAPPYSAAGLQPPRPAVKVFPVPGLGPGA
jgi:hypothetical protein